MLAVRCALAASNSTSNETIFREQILPAVEANCAKCHAGTNPASDLSLGTWDGAIRGGKHGAVIAPGKSTDSLLIQYVRGEKAPRMPVGGALPEAA
jgi:hypothetical protein